MRTHENRHRVTDTLPLDRRTMDATCVVHGSTQANLRNHRSVGTKMSLGLAACLPKLMLQKRRPIEKRATAMQLLHRVATIICIILTLAFGVWCLCASTIMSLPHVDARHGPLYR